MRVVTFAASLISGVTHVVGTNAMGDCSPPRRDIKGFTLSVARASCLSSSASIHDSSDAVSFTEFGCFRAHRAEEHTLFVQRQRNNRKADTSRQALGDPSAAILRRTRGRKNHWAYRAVQIELWQASA
jgi:hypothetical protein